MVTGLMFLFLVFMFRIRLYGELAENQYNNLTWKFSIAILLCDVRGSEKFESAWVEILVGFLTALIYIV